MPAWSLLLACASPPASPAVGVDPAHGSLAGGYPLTLSGIDAAEVTAVSVGGLVAYGLRAEGDTLRVTVQGAPAPGPASIVLTTPDGDRELETRFVYDPPADAILDRVYTLGASYSEGVQAGVPNLHGQLASPSAVLARQAGAWAGLPLLVPDLFPTLTVADLGPPPGCAIPDIEAYERQAAVDILARLVDEDGEFSYAVGRIDPATEPRDVAVGGSNLAQMIEPTEDFGHSFLAHLVYDPYASASDPLTLSQLDVVEAGQPTLVLSYDLLGNDLIGAVTRGEVLDPTAITPVADIEAGLAVLVPRLAATGAEVFLANVPDPTVLGVVRQKRAAMEPAEAEAAVAAIAEAVDAYDRALRAAADPYGNVHVVDVAAPIAQVAADGGLDVGTGTVPVTTVGGFVSLDGLHLSDTGYAFLAEVFAAALAEAGGPSFPAPDLAAVQAADPYSVDALVAEGLDVHACE